jgi:hypothetical protein
MKTITMYQSDYDDPTYYCLAEYQEAIITGVMGGCVSIIALSEPHGGIYRKVCGQHGAGGVKAIDLDGLMEKGHIADSRNTKFIVVFSSHSNTPASVLSDIEEMLEAYTEIQNSQFEFYFSSNAIVDRYGRVTDMTSRLILARSLVFIAKFHGMVKIYRDKEDKKTY